MRIRHALIFRGGIAVCLLLALTAMAQPQRPTANAVPVPAAPQLGAKSYVLMDFHSGELLVEKDANSRVDPASITKVMTGYVVFNELNGGNLALDEVVTVSNKARQAIGSRMFIEASSKVRVEDLIRGMVIQSGNDASIALAEHIAGDEAAFVGLMNHYAVQLGMQNTHFANATGLPDENHYTTARDVAVLSTALIRDFPEYYRWYAEKEFTYNGIRQHNRNMLLWRDPAVDGLKTGHTEAAGYCLAASAMRDGMRLISIVMGAASEEVRANESQALLNYGFRFFETFQLYEAEQELAKARVWKAKEDEVALGLTDNFYVTIPRGRYEELDAQLELTPQLTAPVGQGQVIGELRIHLGQEIVGRRPLVALTEVSQSGFFGRTVDGMRLWFGGLFGGDDDE